MRTLALIFIFISPALSLAGEGGQPSSDLGIMKMTDEQVAQVARQRSYPGGADEGKLQVQDPLSVPYGKLDAKKIQEQVYKELLNSKQSSEGTEDPSEE